MAATGGDFMSDHNNTLHGRGTGSGPDFGAGAVLGGNYELAQPIGRGGMGQVWQARDRAGRREVAVKLLPPELRSQEEAIDQVRASFQKTHSLTHQHIGKTLAMLDDPIAGPFIVMDLIPGVPLSRYAWQHRQTRGALPLAHVLELLRPVALALDYAHQEGVLHQDVKPQNVLVQIGPPLKVSLIDFGIAASIRVSMTRYTHVSPDTAGTRPYMAPERLRGKKKEWDGRSDQYALGAMAYELLSGDPPFVQDGDDFSFIYAVLNEPVDPLDSLSDAVNAALQKSLAKTREERFSSCLEFVQALAAPPVATIPTAPTAVNPPVSPPVAALPTPPPPRPASPPPVSPAIPRRFQTRLVAPFDAQAAAAGQAACARELGVPVEFKNTIGMRFRLIPPGEFSMGGDKHEDEKPIRRVKLTQPFYLGVFPVTQGEYERVMGVNPSYFKGDPRLPVEQVSWNDVNDFIHRLSIHEPNRTYRLPMESQWEYACRAGTTTAFWFGNALNGDRANVNGNHPYGTDKKGPNRQKTTSVDMFPPNPFGLHDMIGNVWEWCQDWYGAYSAGEVTDPAGPPEGSARVIRGGSYASLAVNCRPAVCGRFAPSDRDGNLGFRLALSFVGVPG
jgi:formylglycine-generating enzyme required for sulfatase activity